AFDRPRLAHVESEALRLALDDVGEHDLIKDVVLGQSLRRGRAVETGADDRYLPCAGHKSSPCAAAVRGYCVGICVRPRSQDAAIAARRFSSRAARNSSVVRNGVSFPTSSARSLVILPLSTVSTQTRSSVSAKAVTSGVPSSFPRCASPLVQAKIDAIGFVEVGLPCWCCR